MRKWAQCGTFRGMMLFRWEPAFLQDVVIWMRYRFIDLFSGVQADFLFFFLLKKVFRSFSWAFDEKKRSHKAQDLWNINKKKHLNTVDLDDAFGLITPEALNSWPGLGLTSAPRLKELPCQSAAADVSRCSRCSDPSQSERRLPRVGWSGKERKCDCETHRDVALHLRPCELGTSDSLRGVCLNWVLFVCCSQSGRNPWTEAAFWLTFPAHFFLRSTCFILCSSLPPLPPCLPFSFFLSGHNDEWKWLGISLWWLTDMFSKVEPVTQSCESHRNYLLSGFQGQRGTERALCNKKQNSCNNK